jgi:hypothetical protein
MDKTYRKEKPKILKYSRSHQHPVMATDKNKVQNFRTWRAVTVDSP